MFKKVLIGALAGCVMSGTAMAGDHAKDTYDERWYMGIGAQYIDADGDERNTEDSFGGRLLLGKPVANGINLELGLGAGFFNDSDSLVNPNTLEQDEMSLTLDALFFLWCQHKRVRPYAELGIGAISTEDSGPSNADTTDFTWDAGLGVWWDITPRGFALRADVRHRVVYWEDDAARELAVGRDDLTPDEWVVNFGMIFPFGDPPAKPAKKMAAPAPAQPNDSDGDGVFDANDKCPGTPAGTPVDASGCPVTGDADGDGVIDSLDKCPNTPAGTSVDVNGCPVPETVVIYFAFDSSELNAPAQRALDRVATNLKDRNFVVAIANGHADATGTAEYNLGLSERRAKAVADYLASRGVAASQIRQRAYGETRPAAPDDTAEGRAKNRRVEINLLRQ